MPENRISIDLTQPVFEQILTKYDELDALLAFLLTITPEERRALAKLGDGAVSFMDKSSDYARDLPALVPNYVNMDEMRRDLALYKQLTEIERRHARLMQRIADTMDIAGAEAYFEARSFYAAVKQAAKTGVAGAQLAYDDMSKQFPGRPSRRPNE
jgi:hypothetical protein